jgi:hypothetical protein
MAYYEISRNPALTLNEVQDRIREKAPAVIGAIIKGRLVYRDDSSIGVRIDSMQTPSGTLLRAVIIKGRLNPFLWIFMRAFPPAVIVYLLLLPVIARQGLLGEVERAIFGAFPGSVRLPVGEGTRRARPGLYRFLGFLKLFAGLIVAAIGVGLSHFWYNVPGLAPVQLLAAAIPAALGLSLAYAGAHNLALAPLEWRRFGAAVFICAALSPYLFKAFSTYEERSHWKRLETESGELYDYRNLPRGLWRADYCLRLAQWRSDQWTKEKLTYNFIREDLEMVVRVIDEFHPHSPAYQPAYRLAKSTLDSLDKH